MTIAVRQELLCVHCAKAKAGIWLCETQVGYLLVEGFEIRQMRCLAQGQGIAKDSLNAGEPPRRQRVVLRKPKRLGSEAAVPNVLLGMTLPPCVPGTDVMKGGTARAPISGIVRASASCAKLRRRMDGVAPTMLAGWTEHMAT